MREGRYPPALRLAGAARGRGRATGSWRDAAGAAPVQLHGRGRGALHQPVGARLPARVPPARTAAHDLRRASSLHAYTATATARVRQRHRQRSSACATPLELVGSFDRPNLIYRVLPRAALKKQILDVLARHRGQAGIIYCTSRRDVDALAAWLTEERRPRRALPRRALGRGAAPQPGRVPRRARRRRRGDGGVRHGHRSVGRALRGPRRRAAVAGALPAGIGPRRPRRPRGRVRADLLGRRLPQVAA